MESIGTRVYGRGLAAKREIRARGSIFVHYAFGEQVIDSLAGFRFVRCEHVIEGTILSDDHDDVFDGCFGVGFFCGRDSGCG